MVHYGPHQAMSDATPIARGNTPLTIPILTAGIGACAFVLKDTDICPTFARDNRNVPHAALLAAVRSGIHTNAPLNARTFIGLWSEDHDLSVLPPFASYFS
jgi:hypothetical protein